ncbi:MAG: hypothetical protein ACR2KE_08500 [Candidatus Nanopelagicales bacterium]
MMKKLSVIVAALTLPAALMIPSTAASADQLAGKREVYKCQVTFAKVIDIGDSGTSHGDIAVRNGVIRNGKGKELGRFTSTQIVVDFDNTRGTEDRQAFIQLNLPGGSVMLVGTITATQGSAPSTPLIYAISGGTGKYIGARGTMTSTPLPAPASFNVVLDFV